VGQIIIQLGQGVFFDTNEIHIVLSWDNVGLAGRAEIILRGLGIGNRFSHKCLQEQILNLLFCSFD